MRERQIEFYGTWSGDEKETVQKAVLEFESRVNPMPAREGRWNWTCSRYPTEDETLYVATSMFFGASLVAHSAGALAEKITAMPDSIASTEPQSGFEETG